MSLVIQFQTMFAMVTMGLVIGMNIDFYHRLTFKWIRAWWTRAVFDLVFWVIQALLVFYVLLSVNEGELRIYIYLALAIGFVGYRKVGRKSFLKNMERGFAFVHWVFRFVCTCVRVIFILPVKFILKQMATLGMIGLTLLLNLLHLIFKLLFFPLQLAGRSLFPIFKRFIPSIILRAVEKCFYKIRKWGKGK